MPSQIFNVLDNGGQRESDGDPIVTVIVNCYNGERYLQEALDSVKGQTLTDWEIVFWDNASTDRSAEIAKSVGQKLRYFRSEVNRPLGEARNEALAKARGTFIAFLDCDDILLPDALATETAALIESSCALVYAGSIYIDGEGKEFRRKIPVPRKGWLLPQQLSQYEIGLPAVMLRRAALLEQRLGFDTNLYTVEDYCLFMQIAAAYEILSLPRVLAKYRVHVNALTLKTISRWGPELDYALDTIISRYPDAARKAGRSMKAARGRAAYYRARNHVVNRERLKAIRAFSPHVFAEYRHPFLFILLLLPFMFWDSIHEWHTKRLFR